MTGKTVTVGEAPALEPLARALRQLAEGSSVDEALRAIVEGTAAAISAEVVILRLLDESTGILEARAVSASSTAMTAELQGSRSFPASTTGTSLSTGERLGLAVSLEVPIALGERELGRLELLRHKPPFTADEEALARLAAGHATVALSGVGGNGGSASPLPPRELLRLGGDALATGLDESRTAEEIARLAAEGSGAESAVVWRLDKDLQPQVAGSFRAEQADPEGVAEALGARTSFSIAAGSWVLQLGQPPLGALQLRFAQPVLPSDEVLDALTTFAARAAHALRSSEHARRQSVELERSRALVAVVGQAIAQLSLAHTLETAIARIAELLGAEHLAVYLLEPEEERLVEAAAGDVPGVDGVFQVGEQAAEDGGEPLELWLGCRQVQRVG